MPLAIFVSPIWSFDESIHVLSCLTRGKNIFRATFLASGFSYVGQALALIAVPLYLRGLGAENYGLMLAALTLYSYFGLSDGGLSWGSMILMGHAYGRKDRNEMAHIFRHGVVLALVSGAVAVVAAVLVYSASRHGWRLPMFRNYQAADNLVLMVGLQAGFTPLMAMFYNVYYSLQEAHWPAMLQGCGRLLGTLAGIGAAVWWRDAGLVLAANLAMSLLMGVVAAIGLWRRHSWIFARGKCRDINQYQQQIRTGGKNFLLQMSRVLVGTAPVVMLSTFAGPAIVPLYTLSLALFQVALVPQQTWAAYAQAAYGDAWANGHLNWIVDLLGQSLRIGLFLGGLMLSVGGIIVGPLVTLISHDKLYPPALMGFGVAAASVTAIFATMGQYVLTGINRQRYAALAELGNGLLCMVCCAAAVQWFGVVAIGWGAVVAALASSLWVLRREICRHLQIPGLPIEGALVAKVALVAGLTAAALWFWPVDEAAAWGKRVAAVAAQCVGGTLLFGLLAWMVGAFPTQELSAGWLRVRERLGI